MKYIDKKKAKYVITFIQKFLKALLRHFLNILYLLILDFYCLDTLTFLECVYTSVINDLEWL